MKVYYHIARLFCVFIFCASLFHSYAQQSSHFYLGSDEFANRHIYSLIHHSDKLLYVGTNDGLLVYKNGAFETIKPAPGQIGNSIFSLVGNSKGVLHCANLSGQLFKVIDGRLVYLDQLPPEFLGSGVMFTFDANDILIVVSDGIVKRQDDQWQRIYNPSTQFQFQVNPFDRSNILTSDSSNAQIICLQNGAFGPEVMLPTEFIGFSSSFFSGRLNGDLISMNNQGTIYKHEDKQIEYLKGLNVREYIQVDDNQIWALDQTRGLQLISMKNKELNLGALLFESEFISSISRSNNGTIFLGTFNHGIVVIPNIDSDVTFIENRYLASICATSSAIVALDNSGSIYAISDNELTLYKEKASYERGNVMSFPGVNFGIDPNQKSLIYDFQLGKIKTLIGVLKDGVQIDETTAILATSKGLFRKGEGANQLNWIDCFNGFNDFNGWSRLSPKSYRARAVTFDTKNHDLYYSTQKELRQLNAKGQLDVIKIDGEDIACNDLIYKNGFVWCATQKYGILKIKNGKIVKKISIDHGLGNAYVFKIEFYDAKLFISHRSGFQIYNESNHRWKSIGTAEGVKNGSVRSFTFHNSKLYVLSRGKLISLPLDQLEKKPDYVLHIPLVKLGSFELKEGRESSYSYGQNHLIVKFDFRGIEFESEARIQYRLIGLSDKWKEMVSTTSEVEFNALAAGEYELQIRTKYRSVITESQCYPFNVTPPFWQTIGFYMLIVFFTIVVLVVFFRFRLKRSRIEQKRALDRQKMQTDLFESELKALRSQMNPHFIFNSLNSIQALVLKEDTESSYDYITLFAKLVRNTLNYSNREFIPIESELEFLEVYLSLEKLRFGDSFNYEIVFDGDKNIDVPSLLVQPFIENALVHGLMHRKGLKELSIRFELTDLLTCTIIDNGIGREKSREIQKRRNGDHESFALSAIEQRMNLLNKQLGDQVGSYKIEDLYKDTVATGTKVKIVIPFIPHY